MADELQGRRYACQFEISNSEPDGHCALALQFETMRVAPSKQEIPLAKSPPFERFFRLSMKTSCFVITIWLALTAAAFARIGDDEKQIESLYGKAAKMLEERGSVRKVGYTAGAFAVVVDFVNGFSRREGFAKPDTSSLTAEEIQQILKVSVADNTTWEEQPVRAGDRIWKRSDDKAVAVLPAGGTFFVVQDPSYVQPQ
jgi:hypothetical protein